MVEKISFTPEEIRGYGNIVSVHSLDDYECYDGVLSETTDTIDGATVTVYEMEYQTDTEATTISMTASSQSFVVGGSVTFTATLLDNELSGVSGVTITFKDGTSTLGTGTTNSSGVATYTTSSLTAGSHSITAVFAGNSSYTGSTSSAVSVTVLAHSYNLTFSASEYASTGGSASVTCTLTDNSVAVSGATVTFTGGTSTVTGTTDSDGDVTVTVSVTQTSTITATYSGTTATCTVTVPSGPLFYDDCSTDRTSDYELLNVSGFRNSLATWSYDSTNHLYNLGTGSYNNANYGLLIKNLTVGSCKITAKVQVNTSNNVQIGVGLHNNSDTSVQIVSRLVKTNNTISIIRVVPDTSIANKSQTLSTNTDYIIEFTNDNGSLTFELYNSSGTLLKTLTGSTTLLSASNNTPFIFFGYQSNQTAKLKELKVEEL